MLNLELEDVTDKLKYLKIVSALSSMEQLQLWFSPNKLVNLCCFFIFPQTSLSTYAV